MKSATHHSKNKRKKKNKNNNNIHMNLNLSYYRKLVGSKTGYAGNKICLPPSLFHESQFHLFFFNSGQ